MPDGQIVECYSGSWYAERPVAIYWQEQRVEIIKILNEWRIPEGRFFRVLTETQMIFDIIYSEGTDMWTIEPR